MDERSFDNLVRDLAASAQSRRALALATVGLALSHAAPMTGETDAARRRQAKRKKNRNKKKDAKKTGGHGGNTSDGCEKPGSCPADEFSGKEGFACADNRCSCGGNCCAKGYSCFLDIDLKQEICCFDDQGVAAIPQGADYAVCIDDREVCCDIKACNEGTCTPPEHGISPSRYRRNPR